MHVTVGEIHEINRYPVKSFGGERLEICDVEPYGLLGDRFGAFYDETKEGWSKYVTARKIPAMLTYRASYAGGEIRVTAADGRTFGWDENLLDEIQKLTDTRIAMSRLKDPHPEYPHLLSVDEASILLITDASLRKLENLWGKNLDQRRFRSNFAVKLLSGESPNEGDWIGRTLDIGEAQLRVDGYCERCVMVTMDPDHNGKDPSLLNMVNQSFNLNFGVYASVIKTGRIRLGDEVKLTDEALSQD